MPFRRAIQFFLFVLILLGAYRGVLHFQLEPRQNIILIVVDTLRADHLSVYGHSAKTSPTMDRFARENLMAKTAITTGPWTVPSVASMFTGLYPVAHGMISNSKKTDALLHPSKLWRGFEVLAESLRNNGYSTAGLTANGWISAPLGFDQGFDVFSLPPQATASYLNQIAFSLLRSFSRKAEPFFLYLHYFDPHAPYDAPGGFRNAFAHHRYPRKYTSEVQEQLRNYDSEILAVDSALDHLFLQLRSLGLWENTSIIIVGDHGEQFMEYDQTGHGNTVFAEETNVPLLIKSKKKKGIIDTTVSGVDVYSTILDIANIAPPQAIHGVSLLGDLSDRVRCGVISEGTLDRNQKACVAPDGSRVVLSFSGESTDRISKREQIGSTYSQVRGLMAPPEGFSEAEREKIQKLESCFYNTYSNARKERPIGAGLKERLPPEMEEELRSVGYLE